MLSLRRGIPCAVLCLMCGLPCAGAKQALKPGFYNVEKAQAAVDFVIYVPAHLPPGCRITRPLVAPDQRNGEGGAPGQVYIRLGDNLALWEMARSPALLPNRIERVSRAGNAHVWVVAATRGGYRTIIWVHGGTQFGLTGRYRLPQLLRMVESMTPAAPGITPLELPPEALPPGGIGATLWLFGERFVDEVAEGSPAQAAGVRPGDEILAVDGRPVRLLRPQQIVRLVRGAVGTKVAVTFKRGGQAFTRVLVRAPVPTVVSVRRPLDEAAKSVPFPVLIPQWLPPGFHLSEVAVSTLRPDARGGGPDLEMLYAAGPIGLGPIATIWITEKRAPAGRPLLSRRYVRIGNNHAAVYAARTGEIGLRWRVGATQITVRSAAVPFEDLVKVATWTR